MEPTKSYQDREPESDALAFFKGLWNAFCMMAGVFMAIYLLGVFTGYY